MRWVNHSNKYLHTSFSVHHCLLYIAPQVSVRTSVKVQWQQSILFLALSQTQEITSEWHRQEPAFCGKEQVKGTDNWSDHSTVFLNYAVATHELIREKMGNTKGFGGSEMAPSSGCAPFSGFWVSVAGWLLAIEPFSVRTECKDSFVPVVWDLFVIHLFLISLYSYKWRLSFIILFSLFLFFSVTHYFLFNFFQYICSFKIFFYHLSNSNS